MPTCARALLTMLLLVVCALSATPAAAQYAPNPGFPNPGFPGQGGGQGGGQGAAAAVLIGSWHISVPGNAGSVEIFTIYNNDGSYGQVSYTPNGTVHVRQTWGRYAVQQSGPNELQVHYEPAGALPQQICVQGGTCQPVQPPQAGNDSFQVLDQNTMRNPAGMMQRSQVPPQLSQPVPATVVVAQLPQQPMPSPGRPTPSPYSPRPSYGPRCDDLQQRRICNMNDGRLVTSNGCLVCVAP